LGYDFWGDWEKSAWEPYTLEVIDRFADPHKTFIDLGAWIGPTAMWASRNYGRVLAVEPDRLAYSYLRANVIANTPAVQTLRVAIADYDGEINLVPDPEEGWGSSMTRVALEGDPVSCMSITTLCEQAGVFPDRIGLIKMDIEGAESIVLPSLTEFCIEHHVPLFVSMHQPWWQRPLDVSCFDQFSSVEGIPSGWNSVLALP